MSGKFSSLAKRGIRFRTTDEAKKRRPNQIDSRENCVPVFVVKPAAEEVELPTIVEVDLTGTQQENRPSVFIGQPPFYTNYLAILEHLFYDVNEKKDQVDFALNDNLVSFESMSKEQQFGEWECLGEYFREEDSLPDLNNNPPENDDNYGDHPMDSGDEFFISPRLAADSNANANENRPIRVQYTVPSQRDTIQPEQAGALESVQQQQKPMDMRDELITDAIRVYGKIQFTMGENYEISQKSLKELNKAAIVLIDSFKQRSNVNLFKRTEACRGIQNLLFELLKKGIGNVSSKARHQQQQLDVAGQSNANGRQQQQHQQLQLVVAGQSNANARQQQQHQQLQLVVAGQSSGQSRKISAELFVQQIEGPEVVDMNLWNMPGQRGEWFGLLKRHFDWRNERFFNEEDLQMLDLTESKNDNWEFIYDRIAIKKFDVYEFPCRLDQINFVDNFRDRVKFMIWRHLIGRKLSARYNMIPIGEPTAFSGRIVGRAYLVNNITHLRPRVVIGITNDPNMIVSYDVMMTQAGTVYMECSNHSTTKAKFSCINRITHPDSVNGYDFMLQLLQNHNQMVDGFEVKPTGTHYNSSCIRQNTSQLANRDLNRFWSNPPNTGAQFFNCVSVEFEQRHGVMIASDDTSSWKNVLMSPLDFIKKWHKEHQQYLQNTQQAE